MVEGHPKVLEAFAKAILFDTELIADGREGLNSLSISNAAYISAWTETWAEIPTDEALFEQHLAELCSRETGAKKAGDAESLDALRERWRVRW